MKSLALLVSMFIIVSVWSEKSNLIKAKPTENAIIHRYDTYFNNQMKGGVVDTLYSNLVGRFRLIQGGSFIMGLTPEMGPCKENMANDPVDIINSPCDQIPSHTAKVATFYVGETELTLQSWKKVMGRYPKFSDSINCPTCPVEVTWKQTLLFIQTLRKAEPMINYRLPTEEEWEYAARGGNKPGKTKYAGSNSLEKVGWFGYTEGNAGKYTHPVAKLLPNSMGLYDMSGNVQEWCSDVYGPYEGNPEMPLAKLKVEKARVIRGGSAFYVASVCRISSRGAGNETTSIAGIRLVIQK